MLAADRLGGVFVPMYMCDNGGYMAVGVSNDYGATFNMVKVDTEKDACTDPDPGFGVDSNNTLYMAYHRAHDIKYAYSTDHGQTWSKPASVSPPSLRSFVHVDAVAGDQGKLAIVYRASSDTSNGPDLADGWAAWHMFVAFVEGADGPSPKVTTSIVNSPEDPTQRGAVCTQGVACAGGSRNLLDFVDIAVGPDGRVYTVYADGCDKTCETPADSRARIGIVGIEEAGPRLFADKAPWAKGAKQDAQSSVPDSTTLATLK
ncbi:MAG: sialidase family protein [Candidatus Thermoplasmatota archaeon]